MARKNKTTASNDNGTKIVEVAPVEEVVAVEASAEEKPVEVIPEEKITAPIEETPAPEKKKTVKKTTARKTSEKTTKAVKTAKTVKAETSASEKKTTAKKSASVNVFFQSHGNESAELVEKAKELSGVKSPKSVNLYIKPEENMVYYVVDDISGGFSL